MIFLALIALIILIEIIFPAFFSTIFVAIAKPFWRIEYSIESGSLSSVEKLIIENEQLKSDIANVLTRSEASSLILKENEDLKTLLRRPSVSSGTSSKSSYTLSATSFSSSSLLSSTSSSEIFKQSPYTLAAVLKRPPLYAYDELLIDLGLNDGVVVGNLVYGSGNVLLGKVIETFGDISRVSLFSSPQNKIDVYIGANKTPFEAKGIGGGNIEVEVSKSVSIVEGDIVTIPSIDNQILGRVQSIEKDPIQPFDTVIITSLSNIYEIRYVLIDNIVPTKSLNSKNVKK
jgi:cell shape-determining protein MreC